MKTTLDVAWSCRSLPLKVPLLHAAIAADGSVCVGRRDVPLNCQELEVFSSDLGWPQQFRGFPIEQESETECEDDEDLEEFQSIAMGPVAMVWCPNARHLVTASAGPEWALRHYDIGRGRYEGSFGSHQGDVYNLAWSPEGSFLASTSTWPRHQLKLWECSLDQGLRLAIEPHAEEDSVHDYLPWWEHKWMVNDFYGFGRLSFSPDERWLAVEVRLRTERDRLAVYSLPYLEDYYSFPLPVGSGVSDMSWDHQGSHVLVADQGEGMLLVGPVSDRVPTATRRLPKRAYRCQINPRLPFCAVAYRSGEESRYTSDLELAPDHVIEILVWPSLRMVAQFRGCSSVRQLIWASTGRDLYGLTAGGHVLRCHIVGGRWVDLD
jgi:WD40 repeat protein